MARRQQRLEALAEETGCIVQVLDVRVTEICPGRVSTEFFDIAVDDPEQRAAIKETGISELTAQDIADAVLYAVDAPWRVNVSLIELQPTEQVFGGMNVVPAD
jgi:NADP-dependent 3-hydroxy acid dehydrogenase YdfG